MFVLFHNGSDGLERVFVTFHQDSSVRSENVLEEKCQIKTLVDLKWWIDDYCAAMKKRDPTSPQIKVILDAVMFDLARLKKRCGNL